MPITLYYAKLSPPARSVLLTIKALGLDVKLKEVDLLNGGQMKPEFLKMNPQHTVPVLVDNSFCIWDSHAINAYLVTVHGKDDSLYPKDPEKRSAVDQRLHFDSGILFPRLKAMGFPVLRLGATSIPEDKKKDAVDAYEMLNNIIGDNEWVAGNQMTIADFCCVASISSINFMAPGLDKFPKLSAWFKRCKTQMVGYEEANGAGNEIFRQLITSKLEKKVTNPRMQWQT